MLFIILYKPLDLFHVRSMANLLELELHTHDCVGCALKTVSLASVELCGMCSMWDGYFVQIFLISLLFIRERLYNITAVLQ